MMKLADIHLGLGILLALLSLSASAESIPIAIITHNETNIDSLNIAELKLIYLKKKAYWKTGVPILAINLPGEHALRKKFAKTVMGVLPDEQVNYWNMLYFNGIYPPQIIESQEGVIRLVSSTPGAIGYLHPCAVDKRIKQVFWLYPDGNVTLRSPRMKCHHLND